MFGPKAYIHSKRFKINLENIQKYIGNKRLMLVVKANAYGHGAQQISSIIKKDMPNLFLCVFSIDEAIELRSFGVKNKILVLSKIESDWLSDALELDLSINISNLNDFKIISEFYKNINKCPSFHLKFDTGMTRLGFDKKEIKKVINFLLNNKKLPLEGLYSHFATSDEGDLSYAYDQLRKFNEILFAMKKVNINIPYIHCSNSGSILNLPDSYFNIVRVGMLAYGVSPSKEVNMKIDVEPVMSFCGSIVNIRTVKPGTQISYGGGYKVNVKSNIAVVQTGFADGLPRNWYENGYVSHNGKYYKIAGRICMDQLMIDFGSDTPTEGEDVLFFGKKDQNEIHIEKIANEINTTTYVLLTAIRGRTDRFLI
jgi:alanine racemase